MVKTIVRVAVMVSIAVACYAEDKIQIKSWDELKTYTQHPEWIIDAKLGIYTHWGPSTVANSRTEDGRGHGQYAMLMYNKEHSNGNFEYHKEKWGDQSQFGYKDIIPLFKAEKFNADEWARLFKKAGAKFAGPVASHHDGYLLWDSKVSRWNSKQIGPGRDVAGELAKAFRKQGLTFIGTFHHSRSWQYMENSHDYDGLTPGYEDLYWPHKRGAKHSKKFLDWWFGTLKEYIDKYEPKYLWFDFALRGIDDSYKRKFLTYYYEKAKEWNTDVLVTYKGKSLPEGIGMLDFERMRPAQMPKEHWITDGSTGPWFYYNGSRSRRSDQLIYELVDIVSKKGCLLLNVPPLMDGSIPDDAKQALNGLGAWLKVNGEAIYNTRAWKTFGEGPLTKCKGDILDKKAAGKKLSEKEQRLLKSKDHRIHLVKNQRFSAKEIRFTRSKDNKTLYAIVMGTPKNDKSVIETLKRDSKLYPKPIKSVELLGSGQALKWEQTHVGLEITFPEALPCKHAYCLKIR